MQSIDMRNIDPMRKVCVSINVAPLSSSEPGFEMQSYEFIYGIGTLGLSPFEKALASQSVGDNVRIDVKAESWSDLFGHLPLPNMKTPPSGQQWEVKVHIHSVSPAGNREVIQALANLTACGGGCGCGCGGH